MPTIVFSHSGRTDAQGGHYDHFNGEYHYHHGEEAHQHPNGICPFDKSSTVASKSTAETTSHSSNLVMPLILFLGLPAAVITIAAIIVRVKEGAREKELKRLQELEERRIERHQKLFYTTINKLLDIDNIYHVYHSKTRFHKKDCKYRKNTECSDLFRTLMDGKLPCQRCFKKDEISLILNTFKETESISQKPDESNS